MSSKAIIKIVIGAIIFLPIIGGFIYMTANMDRVEFESVCDKYNKRYIADYCDNVGKDAWSQKSVLNLNEKNYGTILGVAWRKKGSIISSSNQKKKRRSESNSYYYIIGDPKDTGTQFLRIVTETQPKEKEKALK